MIGIHDILKAKATAICIISNHLFVKENLVETQLLTSSLFSDISFGIVYWFIFKLFYIIMGFQLFYKEKLS